MADTPMWSGLTAGNTDNSQSAGLFQQLIQSMPVQNVMRLYAGLDPGSAMPEAYGSKAPIMDPIARMGLGLGESAYRGITAPGNALVSKEPVTTGQMIRPALDLAGMTTLGAGAIPAEANSLRIGIKGLPETVKSAAVHINGQLFEAPNHVLALDKAERALGANAVQDAVSGKIGGGPDPSGFVTSSGRFVDRAEAGKITQAATHHSGTLRSEDIRQ